MPDMDSVLGLILGGGRGTRLFPLTGERAKPAAPIAGKYRLIDIPISNCLNSDIDKIAILTQFKSVSLHRHITRTYRRDAFTNGWVEILAAEQSWETSDWYQGTADAVRQQWIEIKNSQADYVLILAGDHLYRMDYREFVDFHIETGADVTLAVQPVEAEYAPAFGILKRDPDGTIVSFTEKPPPDQLDGLESIPNSDKPFMASMGIYVFSTKFLSHLLKQPGDDFGKHLVPHAINNHKVMGFIYDGYWADIGTLKRFYEVNLEMATVDRPFNLSSPDWPIYTRPRFLAPADIYNSKLDQVLLTEGCKITGSDLSLAVVGLRSQIGPNATIRSSVIMGADYYETDKHREQNRRDGVPDIGIGEGSVIEGALIDKNARIGRNVHIRHIPDREDETNENWTASDGIVVLPKGAVIPDDTVV